MVKTEAPAYAKAAGNSYSLHLPLARLSSTLRGRPNLALPEVAVHSAVASGEPLEASAGEPLVGRQGPVERTLDAGYALRQGVQVAAVR